MGKAKTQISEETGEQFIAAYLGRWKEAEGVVSDSVHSGGLEAGAQVRDMAMTASWRSPMQKYPTS